MLGSTICLFPILILCLISPLVAHECIHNKIAGKVKKEFLEISPTANSSRILAEKTYAPIRIHADFTNISSSLSPEAISFIKNRIIPATKNFFESVLSVVPFEEPIVFRGYRYCFEAPISKALQSTGVNADLVLFVTAAPTDDNFLAWATPCFFDPVTTRPVAGQININSKLMSMKASDFQDQLHTYIHETTHVLGFSSMLYADFIDPATNKPLPLEKVFQFSNIRGVLTPLIVMPQVVNVAKTYFNCSNMIGVELENQGTEASLGSHWERRILGDEYMTASSKYDSKISEFTLAFLEGTGWYRVNYSKAEYLFWGRGRGCAFLTESCITEDFHARFPEFCDRLNGEYCTFDHLYKGVCAIRDSGVNMSISSWDYFKNGTIALDPFSDNCPYAIYYSNGDCREPGPQYRAIDQAYGKDSRCFEGNLIKEGFMPLRDATITYCLQFSCHAIEWADVYRMNVQIGANTVTCEYSGQQITVPGYTGTLKCPDPKYFCLNSARKYCRNGCTGRGECINDTCVCKDGWDENYDCALSKDQLNCTHCDGGPCNGDYCVGKNANRLTTALSGLLLLLLVCLSI